MKAPSIQVGITAAVDGRPGRGIEFIHGVAAAAERVGFASWWVPDHVVFFDNYESKYPYNDTGAPPIGPDQGLYEPLMVLQAAAAATTTLRLGTGIDLLPERNPLIRARELATLDHFSNGRVDYGIGVGWSWEEFAALGVPWERRGKRTDEYIGALKAAWTQHRATYTGEFVNFTDVVAFPKPIQEPHPPVFVGGTTDAALRRAARLGEGWLGFAVRPDQLAGRLAVLDKELANAGRVRDGFLVYLGIGAAPDKLRAYIDAVADQGVDQVIVGAPLSGKRYEGQLEELAGTLGLSG